MHIVTAVNLPLLVPGCGMGTERKDCQFRIEVLRIAKKSLQELAAANASLWWHHVRDLALKIQPSRGDPVSGDS